MTNTPRCPKCNLRILQYSGTDKVKLRTNIVVFKSNTAEIKCPRCKSDVVLDIRLGEELRKSLENPPKLLVRKKLDVNRPPS